MARGLERAGGLVVQVGPPARLRQPFALYGRWLAPLARVLPEQQKVEYGQGRGYIMSMAFMNRSTKPPQHATLDSRGKLLDMLRQSDEDIKARRFVPVDAVLADIDSVLENLDSETPPPLPPIK